MSGLTVWKLDYHSHRGGCSFVFHSYLFFNSILDQMRLEAQRDQWPRVRVGGRKINRAFLKEDGNTVSGEQRHEGLDGWNPQYPVVKKSRVLTLWSRMFCDIGPQTSVLRSFDPIGVT